MSASKDSPMDGTSSGDADVILNRLNVALARSQKLINSWLPPKPSDERSAQDEDEDDFKPMTEAGGIGSKAAFDSDEGLPDGAFQPKKLSSNDKLLEQLLGRKAAQARKKSQAQDVGKRMSAARHAAPKPLVSRPKQPVESEDDEEEGRAASFKSRKLQNPPPVERSRDGDEMLGGDSGSDANTGLGLVRGEESGPVAESKRESRPTKRNQGSYLDEVLAQRANKKTKKKRQNKPL